ncbi:transposase, partial [Streptomyces sp. NPDC059680]|uniref:IS110 family transposase n=1 Tax=Streptomyces sp. NPDC059680 TaxID=3346904 RepID=UPI003674219B
MTQPMGRVGSCFDNAVSEAFNSVLKVEYVHRQTFFTRTEAQLKIATWITGFYNTLRLHSVCGYRSPTELLKLIADVLDLSAGDPVTWAIDLNAGGAALMIALLTDNGQHVLYIPGRTVHHASASYRGDGKSDAKDAFIIADQARMRRDLEALHRSDDTAVDLRILTSRRLDLAADRTRAINRMRAQMLEYFPALERAFDYSTSKAALVLLGGYQTPAELRRIGKNRLASWLKNRKVRNYKQVAATAVEAAEAQHTAVAGERLAS